MHSGAPRLGTFTACPASAVLCLHGRDEHSSPGHLLSNAKASTDTILLGTLHLHETAVLHDPRPTPSRVQRTCKFPLHAHIHARTGRQTAAGMPYGLLFYAGSWQHVMSTATPKGTTLTVMTLIPGNVGTMCPTQASPRWHDACSTAQSQSPAQNGAEHTL